MKYFDKIANMIPNKFTIDELIEIYSHGIERDKTFYRFFGGCRETSYTNFSYLCNAVVMYYAEKYFFEHNMFGYTEEYLNQQISSSNGIYGVLGALDAFLSDVFCEMVMLREETDERSTTVVEQLLAGAGIDYKSRIAAIDGTPDTEIIPMRGDSTEQCVVSYGIAAVLSFDDCGCCGTDARRWILNQIKELNPNFVLNYTWY